MGFRLLTVFFLFSGLYTWLVLNLYQLQLEKGFYYSAKAASQNSFDNILETKRGNIYFFDRSHNAIPAAINRDFPNIYAVPKEITDAKETAAILEPVADIGREALEKLFYKPGDLYELILEKAAPEQVSAVHSLNLAGIYTDIKTLRFYPFQNLASQVLGFVGINKDNQQPTGLYGLEFFYESQLKGGKGAVGRHLYLTIDRNLQLRAEETLEKLMTDFQSSGGTIIIQEPKTGKILAMAGKPDFDPNFYFRSEIKTFINPVVQTIYEPGSVFKIITMAAGIDSGKFTPETTYYDAGSVKVGDRVIKNWDLKARGKITMTGVIEHSVNTGAVYAEKLIGHEPFFDYLKKFGFGEKTGVDLPGELTGDLKTLQEGRNKSVNFATASFGQGVAVTPLQLINAASAIANGGLLMRPYINEELKPEALDRVMSESASRSVTEMMVSAVDKAAVAAIPKYNVAGKTGTAQIPNFEIGGYSDEFIHNYVGWAPAFNPAFVILIKLDKPKSGFAAVTVVPAFRELAEFILNYYRVPPDRL